MFYWEKERKVNNEAEIALFLPACLPNHLKYGSVHTRTQRRKPALFSYKGNPFMTCARRKKEIQTQKKEETDSVV